MPYKLHTPLGGKVTVITACVDIKFTIKKSGEIIIKNVRLSSKSFIGNGHKVNIASPRQGEAWFASNIRPKSLLFDLAYNELETKNSKLKRIIIGKYNHAKPAHKKLFEPPTEKQIKYAKKLGIKINPGMSKHNVSRAIDEKIASKKL